MEEIKFRACSPPGCNCPELETYKNIDGEDMVMLSDDQQHCCTMTVEEFDKLIYKYINEFKKW